MSKAKHAGGRPRKYTLEEITSFGEAYFNDCEPVLDEEGKYSRKRRPTMTGLTIALGMTRRTCLYDYEGYEEFSDIIKGFRLKVEEYYEECLTDPDQKPTGPIFALKNMKWSDKQEIEHSTIDDDGKPKGFVFVDAPKK